MKTMNKIYLTAIVLVKIILFAQFTYAQDCDNKQWVKIVGRDIDWNETVNETKNYLKFAGKDSSLFAMIRTRLQKGTLEAYPTKDYQFNDPMSLKSINRIFADIYDTIQVTDPITGEELKKIVAIQFDNRLVIKYRIIEKWKYNTETGKTNITIVGLIPLTGAFLGDGSYIGQKGLLLIPFYDVKTVIDLYEQQHPDNRLAEKIWKNYFESNEKPTKEE